MFFRFETNTFLLRSVDQINDGKYIDALLLLRDKECEFFKSPLIPTFTFYFKQKFHQNTNLDNITIIATAMCGDALFHIIIQF